VAESDNEVFLFLDDYHAITDSRPHELTALVLRYAPSNFHLVIMSRTAQLADLGIADVELAIGALNDPVVGPDVLASAGARTCHWHKSVPPVVCRADGLHRNLLARPRIGATISRDYPAWNGCFGGRRSRSEREKVPGTNS
jgi:hypothetical protein